MKDQQMKTLYEVIKYLVITIVFMAGFIVLLVALIFAFTAKDMSREMKVDNCVEWCKR